MTPTSLRRWLDRKRPRSAYLRVAVDRIAQEPLVVAQWTEGEHTEQELCGLVLDTCSDYAEQQGEATKFFIQWCDQHDKPMATAHHKAAPGDYEDKDGKPGPATDIGINGIIAQFMRHDEAREKVLLGALGSIFGASEKTIQLQQQLLTMLLEQQKRDHIELQASRVARSEASEREVSDEEKLEAVARANAMTKFTELAPMVVAHIIDHFTPKGPMQ